MVPQSFWSFGCEKFMVRQRLATSAKSCWCARQVNKMLISNPHRCWYMWKYQYYARVKENSSYLFTFLDIILHVHWTYSIHNTKKCIHCLVISMCLQTYVFPPVLRDTTRAAWRGTADALGTRSPSTAQVLLGCLWESCCLETRCPAAVHSGIDGVAACRFQCWGKKPLRLARRW